MGLLRVGCVTPVVSVSVDVGGASGASPDRWASSRGAGRCHGRPARDYGNRL